MTNQSNPPNDLMTDTQLLPCPFCGGTDIFMEPDEVGSGGQWVYPIHVGCSVRNGGWGATIVAVDADHKEEAASLWNTRAAIQSVMTDTQVTGVIHVTDSLGNYCHSKPVYEARYCPGVPTDCCEYAVISHKTGKEVCRVWDRDDVEKIAELLNRAAIQAMSVSSSDVGELVERLRDALVWNSSPLQCLDRVRAILDESSHTLEKRGGEG